MKGLNKILKAEKGLESKPCSAFELPELHAVQRVLFEARAPDFNKVYDEASDTRGIKHRDSSELEKEQAAIEDLVDRGLCLSDLARRI